MLSCRVKIGPPPRAVLPCTPSMEKAPSRSISFCNGNFPPCNMLQSFSVSPFAASLSQKQGGGGYWSYQSKFTATGLKIGHYRQTNRPAFSPGWTMVAGFSYLALITAHQSRCAERGGIKPPLHEEISAMRRRHGVRIEEDRVVAEEACGKLIFGCNAGLTYWERMLILVSSLVTTLLDRGVEQTLFDNLIDVPESVRLIHRLRA
jgi:hypothetical protein